MEGNVERSLLLYIKMEQKTQLETISHKVEQHLADKQDMFLVHLYIKPKNNIKVYIDGDAGVNIGFLSRLNKKLAREIEESAMFPDGDFSLEVSSPGLDEPLMLHRQYVKNVGRDVEIIGVDDVIITGKLLDVQNTFILLEHIKGKGKKQEVEHIEIPFDNIKKTKIQIKF